MHLTQDAHGDWIPRIDDHHAKLYTPLDRLLADLQRVRWSDNLCSIGWTNIHAHNWTPQAQARAVALCPDGRWAATTIDRDIAKHAYFDFPMDDNGAKFLVAMGMAEVVLVLKAGGGRHKWPTPWRSSGQGYSRGRYIGRGG